VVDEVLGEVFVDGTEVSLGEQGVDERGDGVLVLAHSVHTRSLRRAGERRYPNNLGFRVSRRNAAVAVLRRRFRMMAMRSRDVAAAENS